MFKKLVKSSIAIIVAFSVIMIPNTFATAKAAVNYDEATKQAQTAAEALTSFYGVTSVQYALIDDGDIVISGQSGVYSKEVNIALTKDNMYGIGSVSKVYTTAAVMQLVEQGKIKLDTPVAQYIPEFKMADERYKDITVRMLLNHSSGLMGSTLSNTMLFNDNDTVSMDTLLAKLKTQRLKAAPGEYSVYCNDGFSLAQLLVEKVSGISFSEYVKNNIADPLSLTNTKTPLDNFQKDKLAKTYLTSSLTTLPVENVNAIGAGGIYSTAEDLCRFADIFMYDTDDKVLSDASSKAMAESEYLSGLWCPDEDTNLNFGLGWDSVNTYPFTQYGIKALVKGGDTPFYHCSLVVLPEEGMAMAVLTSGGASTYGQVLAQEVLLKALLAKGSISEIKANKTFSTPIKTTMPSSEKENAGYYALLGGVFKADISDDGVLSLYTGTAMPQQFAYTGDGKFYYSDGGTYVSFEEESNGNTYMYVQGYSMLPSIGQIATAAYQGQKISTNLLSDKVKSAWDKRADKVYYLLNEKYSSAVYSLSAPVTKITLAEGIEGYYQSAKIIDANSAKMLIQIPGIYGRDLFDFTFDTKGKTEYMMAGGAIYASENVVKALSTKASFTVKIGSEGYARWYKINPKSENKKIKVSLPKEASFTVYDANWTCTFSSLTSGKTSTTLPAGGHVVFVGDAKAQFTVKYVK